MNESEKHVCVYILAAIAFCNAGDIEYQLNLFIIELTAKETT